ncbi:DUF3107 domain-containing protein [Allonocardiopsis opalescens]|uniref:Uncharacterized protein DUF3107 n=1 Tax=Allonocardiopsis opalescens TaxID=1144618 RepID=A0A2T0QDJ4_9ACTN|nr:DUF3107 domain-containing protein [Allonocardiopsis opalescens]PRY01985.1 uncharacterized protein DUF3107 [Allonocardiopsis opalescens]
MEIKIGIVTLNREITIETDRSAEDVERELAEVLAHEHGVFSITDEKGNRFVIPADKIGYLEFSALQPQPIGFGRR